MADPHRTRNPHEQHTMRHRSERAKHPAATLVDDRQPLALKADVWHLVAQDLIADAAKKR